MFFLEERINRFTKDLRKLVILDRMEIREMEVRYGEIPKGVQPGSIQDGWEAYMPGTPWCSSSDDQYALFRAKVEIPEAFNGGHLVLGVHTNRQGWNALNPQMLLYLDGKACQGLDTNHMEALLDQEGQAGKVHEVLIYAFSGLTGNAYHTVKDESEVRLYVELYKTDPQIEAFYYDLQVPAQLLGQLEKNSGDYAVLSNILNETVNRVDLRVAHSKEFYESLEEAGRYIQQNLYRGTYGQNATVTCIGHTHIDVAWLWRYCHIRDKAARSFTTALSLMKQYPDYRFMSSQPQLYAFIREDHPEVFEEIRERVKEGRWEPEGGMWVEADTNVPSGESLVRQFLYGKRFFNREFGVNNEILWLPDVFGYSGNLPQIMKKSGIRYFMTSKLVMNEFNRFPYHTFLWKGIDGSEILSQLVLYCSKGYNATVDAEDMVQGWKRYAQKDINDDILLTYGYGDGGGGPTREMVESIRRFGQGLPGSPRAKTGSVRDYFTRLDQKVRVNRHLPRWAGELYFEMHRGTYTSMARNKRNNRKAELLYGAAEWMSSMNQVLLGGSYPYEALSHGWEKILLNQFHDVLPGSSIKEVYEDTDLIYAKVFETGNTVLEKGIVTLAAAIPADRPSLVVFNPLSWERRDAVEFEYPAGGEAVCLEGPDGKRYRCQKTGTAENRYTAVVEGVPSLGYSTFKICEVQPDIDCSSNPLHVSRERLETSAFRIELDEQGHFTRIWDKREGREVLKHGEKGNVLQAFEDKPRGEDNWNLDVYYSEKMWEVNDVESMEVLENGPARGVLRIRRKFLRSVICQDIVIYADIPRIDFKTAIDWKETDLVLKVAFPVEINADRATYEIQFGHLERDTHRNTSWDIAKFEVCGHKWADLSENGYGVSLLNDCKYGHDIQEGRMRLTLLRCGTIPNPDADKERHEFTYSLFPHAGGWREGATLQEAHNLNSSLIGKVIGEQHGILPAAMSLLRTNQEHVIIETVKRAEDGEETILRVYEAYNRRGRVQVDLFQRLKKVEECDLMETPAAQEGLQVLERAFSFDIKPFEIKTFRITFHT